jgi:hypothetical protein
MLGLEHVNDVLDLGGPADEIALAPVAPDLGEAVQLNAGLDPFRRHLEAECVGERDRRGHDGLVRTEPAQPGNERAVDLHSIDDKSLEVVERGVAGPKIVDDDASPK